MNASIDPIASRAKGSAGASGVPAGSATPAGSAHGSHATASSVAAGGDITIREGILEVPGEVALYHGGKLSGMRIAWRIAGPANAPSCAHWAASRPTVACA